MLARLLSWIRGKKHQRELGKEAERIGRRVQYRLVIAQTGAFPWCDPRSRWERFLSRLGIIC